jgi:excisionase family DNA binding protein
VRDELNKVRKFAEQLGISEKTAWAWIAQRRVDVVRLGRSVRVPQSSIDRLIAEGFTPRIEG